MQLPLPACFTEEMGTTLRGDRPSQYDSELHSSHFNPCHWIPSPLQCLPHHGADHTNCSSVHVYIYLFITIDTNSRELAGDKTVLDWQVVLCLEILCYEVMASCKVGNPLRVRKERTFPGEGRIQGKGEEGQEHPSVSEIVLNTSSKVTSVLDAVGHTKYRGERNPVFTWSQNPLEFAVIFSY